MIKRKKKGRKKTPLAVLPSSLFGYFFWGGEVKMFCFFIIHFEKKKFLCRSYYSCVLTIYYSNWVIWKLSISPAANFKMFLITLLFRLSLNYPNSHNMYVCTYVSYLVSRTVMRMCVYVWVFMYECVRE